MRLGLQQMLHPARPSAGTRSTECSIRYYTLPDQVLDVLTQSTGYNNKCYVDGVRHMLLHLARPGAGCNSPVNGIQEMLHPARPGAACTPPTSNYNKCYTLPNQVLVPRRRVQHMLLHPARLSAGCNCSVDGVQQILHPAQPGAGCTPSTG